MNTFENIMENGAFAPKSKCSIFNNIFKYIVSKVSKGAIMEYRVKATIKSVASDKFCKNFWFWVKIRLGSWCFGCCQALRGLLVGFLLLRYSVLCTVESLSLLYLLFIFWFICSGRCCMDKLGVFRANQTSIIWTKGEVGAPCRKPSSKVFLLTVPRWYCFCGSFVLFMSCVFHAFASVHCCLVVTCWEWADLLALVCDV